MPCLCVCLCNGAKRVSGRCGGVAPIYPLPLLCTGCGMDTWIHLDLDTPTATAIESQDTPVTCVWTRLYADTLVARSNTH